MEQSPTTSMIYAELIRLNGNLEKHVDLTKERQDRHAERIERHSMEIYGNGEKDPGLKSSMTRVLLIQQASLWVIGAMATGFLGLLVNTLWNALLKH